MKTKNRTIKAIAVIIVVGIGVFCNTNYKINVTNESYSFSNTRDEIKIKADSTENTRSRIFDYTKSILQSGIQHLISNL